MKPPPFDYQAPESLKEALQLLEQAGSQAKVLAGGQSLVPLLNMRLVRPSLIIDINRIGGLDYLREEDGELVVGALVRHRHILASPLVREGWPLLAEATAFVGHPAIRNRGTLCGSIAHADPAAEQPAVLCALEGSVVLAGPAGRRVVPALEFFVTYLTTALEPEEMVVEVRFPRLPHGSGTAFVEFARRHGDFAIVGVAAALTVQEDECRDARIALAGVGGTPLRAREAEEMLKGHLLRGPEGAARLRRAAQQVAASVQPPDDVHASARYRRHLAGVLTEQALTEALRRASGQ